MESIPKHVKYAEHFQGECLIHYYNMPSMYIFICAMWNNKECKIMRKDWVTRQTPHNDVVSTRKHGNLFARWMLHTFIRFELESQFFFIFLFQRLSYTVASLIGFYCLCKNEKHTLSVSTGDHVHAARQYMHPHMKQHAEAHVHSLRTEDNTHRSLDGTDTNKHTQLTD